MACYQKGILHLRRYIDSSLIDWRATCKWCFTARQNRYPLSVPRQVSNLTIYLKTVLKLLPILNSSLMFACVPSSLPGRIEQHALIETLQLPQRYLFCSCNRVPSQRALRAGWFPNFRPHAVPGLCAHRRRRVLR